MMRSITRKILAIALFISSGAFAQGSGVEKIAFLSDSQDPNWFELLVLKSNHNAQAREMVFRNILSERPLAVVHLGDMVAAGSRDGAWEAIDRFVDSVRAEGVAFYPIFGNHEYFFTARKGWNNFNRRFPEATVAGRLLRFESTAIVLLNSNLSQLSEEQQQRQSLWYRQTLETLDTDSSVAFIIVGCHHSPYTNSTIVSPSQDVDTAFVPPFLAARKAVVFLTGHCHAFEHFRKGGKDFLVIGGGGGLLQPLLTGQRRRYEDLYAEGGTTRMFHYLVCSVEPSRVQLEVKMLKDDFSGFSRAAFLEFRAPHVSAPLEGKKKTPSLEGDRVIKKPH
jgi:hypothetical protein